MERIARLLSVMAIMVVFAGCTSLQTPVAGYSVAEGGALVVQPARGILRDSHGGSATLVRGPEHASVFNLRRSGGFRYVHNGTETLSDSFTYAVGNGGDSLLTRRALIEIRPVNDAPIIRDLTLRTRAQTTVTGRLMAFDPDDAVLQYSVEAPSGGDVRLDTRSGELSYDPAAGFVGTDRFMVTVSDGKAERHATVTIHVEAGSD